MGDMNYFKLSQKVSDDLEISLDDAKEWLDGKVHMKNRHRFVGNFLQRKGANGWEKDLDWVNQHYFNMVSRYVAMDPFKSKSISTFERLFGQYDKEYQGLANYTKEYINDVNGVPNEIEDAINNSLNSNKYFRRGGPVSQVLLQFKKYPIKQMELMVDLAKHGDIGQNAKFWVPYMLLSGIWGIPLLSIFKEVFGWFGWDWDDEAKKAMFEWAGKDEYRQALVKTAWYGLLSNTAYGIDVSKRTGIGDAVPTSVKDMAGPVIGTIYQTAKEISRGNGFEAVKAVSPGIGNILVTAAGEIHGDRGRVKTKYEEMYERIQKGLGFMPVSESMANDRDWVENSMKRKIRDEVSDAIDDYLEAEANKDTNAKQKSMKELQRLKVSPKQVANERMQKQRTNLQRTEKSIPKKYRNEFTDIQQFK